MFIVVALMVPAKFLNTELLKHLPIVISAHGHAFLQIGSPIRLKIVWAANLHNVLEDVRVIVGAIW